MAKGKIGKIARVKARKAYKSAKRWSKRKLAKAYAQVSGKLVAVTGLKNKRKYKRRY